MINKDKRRNWPDLCGDATVREGVGWINLFQAAAARIERDPK